MNDLILNEMPDIGLLRVKAYQQRNLPHDQRDFDLEEQAEEDMFVIISLGYLMEIKFFE